MILLLSGDSQTWVSQVYITPQSSSDYGDELVRKSGIQMATLSRL